MSATILRYQLPKKAIKGDCPQCGPKNRKTLSRYIDTRTGEPLPEVYGRCDRESNCTYHLSPYHKGPSGMSYANQVFEQWKQDNSLSRAGTSTEKLPQITSSPSSPPEPIYTIPDEVVNASLGHYQRNRLAVLLSNRFGSRLATDLLSRFQIGTSSRWPGATVFWLIDEQNRARGGQIKLFADDWHTEKYTDREGRKRAKVDWVHSALKYRYEQKKAPLPNWLQTYIDNAERSPCLFGVHQLANAPSTMPVAIVEAPKTALICTAHFPGFVWLATVGRSYLQVDRMEPLRGRAVTLFPDLSANGVDYTYWQRKADELNRLGFVVNVSDFLEGLATDEQCEKGADLADFLLNEPSVVAELADQLTRPGSTLRPMPDDVEQLPQLLEEYDYPTEWNQPNPDAVRPTIQLLTFQKHFEISPLGAQP